jgi:gamma-glutamyltranspeptidase/glutathione hydrolase
MAERNQNVPTGRLGPKPPVTAREAVAASQHPIATQTMLEVMRAGGNAVDAGVAGSLVQAGIQQDMSNHGGTVSFLYWEASTGKTYELNSWGTIVPGLAPFRPIPEGRGLFSGSFAAIPGTIPGLKAIHQRFGSKPWAELCQPAIRWAEEGHQVDSFEHFVLAQSAQVYLNTVSGRAHFTPNGYLPQVGDRWPKPELAKSLRGLADEGPDYFITGSWAEAFVKRANELGWKIELEHMAAEPRWGTGLRHRHGDYELVQLSPPEVLGVATSIFLGVLEHLDVTSFGHYAESAEAFYYVAHALRRAGQEVGFVNDPHVFEDSTAALTSPEFHAHVAELVRRSKPKIDLREHVELVAGKTALLGAGAQHQTLGSCEMSIVDPQGNVVQMMHTLQGGGLPGEVIGGVPMTGSGAGTNFSSAIGAWFAGGARQRGVIGHTFVLKDGRPVWSLGTPGMPLWTLPQVLLNGLDYDMDPYAAEDTPRMFGLTDDYRVPVESRISTDVIDGLASLGILVDPWPGYDYHMGSFQMNWRDPDGTLHGSAGPRRAGSADGF